MEQTPFLLAPAPMDAFWVLLLAAAAVWLCRKKANTLKYSLLERRLLLLGLGAFLLGGLALGIVTWKQLLPTDDSLNFYKSALYLKQLTLTGHPDALRLWTLPPWGFSPEDLLARHRLHMLALDSVYHVAFVKLLTVLLFALGNSYYGSGIVLGAIGFSGIWALYAAFRKELAGRGHWALLLVVCFPSVILWSGGVMKEPVLLAGMGWGVWAAVQWQVKARHSAWVWTAAGLMVLLAFCIKPFLMQALALALLGGWLAFYVARQWRIPRTWGLVALLVAGGLGLMYLTTYTPSRILDEMRYYQIAIRASGIQGNSSFELGWQAPYTVADGLLLFPWAAFTGLFRPFVWEARNMAGVVMGLEAAVQLVAALWLLWRADWRGMWARRTVPPVWAVGFLLFAVVSAGFLGLTLMNFGTLVRYRVVLLPFLWLGLLLLPQRHAQPNVTHDTSR